MHDRDLGQRIARLAQTWYVAASASGIFIGLLGATVLGLGAANALASRAPMGVVASAWFLGLAALLAGTVLGLVFGIPRRLRQGDGDEPADDSRAGGGAERNPYNGNGSLEQISDWLTKILVGAGLVQLAAMPEQFQRLGRYAAGALAWTSDPVTSGAAGVRGLDAACFGLIAYFFVLGFLDGYFFARLWLPQILPFAERNPLGRLQFAERRPLGELPVRIKEGGPQAQSLTAPPSVEKTAAVVRGVSYEELRGVDDLRQWAKAQWLDNKLDGALLAFSTAVARAPTDLTLRTEYASALHAAGRVLEAAQQYDVALDIALETRSSIRFEVLGDAMYAYLWVEKPAGFRGALACYARFVERDGSAATGRALIQVRLAAAHGQAHQWFSARNNADEAARHVRPALDAVSCAVNADASMKPLIAGMLDAKAIDDDLATLEEEVRTLL